MAGDPDAMQPGGCPNRDHEEDRKRSGHISDVSIGKAADRVAEPALDEQCDNSDENHDNISCVQVRFHLIEPGQAGLPHP